MCAFIQPGGPNVFSQQSVRDILDHVNDDGVCLDAVGDAELYTTDGLRNLSLLRQYNWRTTWTHIIPGNFGGDAWPDLFFDDRRLGRFEFYTTDGQGGLTPLGPLDMSTTPNLEIIPGNFGGDNRTDLFFYDRARGLGQFIRSDDRGILIPLSPLFPLRGSWDLIIPGQFGQVGPGDLGWADLLFYDRTAGTRGQLEGEIVLSDGQSNLVMPRQFDWRDTWDLIIANNFAGSGWTDIIFYER